MMKTKRLPNFYALISAAAVSGIAMWVLAGLWHEGIMAHFYQKAHGDSHQGLGLILVAYLVLAGLMAIAAPWFFKQGRPGARGLQMGIWVGCLWVFPHGLALAAAHGDSLIYVCQNAAWHLVEQGFGGWVLGVCYSKWRPELFQM
jgi:hypothetical protein